MCDLGKSFQKFVNGFFMPYRGVILERKGGGYVCLGIFCATKEKVDQVIDDHMKKLTSSLNRIKTQS